MKTTGSSDPEHRPRPFSCETRNVHHTRGFTLLIDDDDDVDDVDDSWFLVVSAAMQIDMRSRENLNIEPVEWKHELNQEHEPKARDLIC